MARHRTAGAGSGSSRARLIHPNPFRAPRPPCRPRSSAPASASPSCGPGNGVLRAETGGRFQAQSAGERPEFGSQTATRLFARLGLRHMGRPVWRILSSNSPSYVAGGDPPPCKENEEMDVTAPRIAPGEDQGTPPITVAAPPQSPQGEKTGGGENQTPPPVKSPTTCDTNKKIQCSKEAYAGIHDVCPLQPDESKMLSCMDGFVNRYRECDWGAGLTNPLILKDSKTPEFLIPHDDVANRAGRRACASRLIGWNWFMIF